MPGNHELRGPRRSATRSSTARRGRAHPPILPYGPQDLQWVGEHPRRSSTGGAGRGCSSTRTRPVDQNAGNWSTGCGPFSRDMTHVYITPRPTATTSSASASCSRRFPQAKAGSPRREPSTASRTPGRGRGQLEGFWERLFPGQIPVADRLPPRVLNGGPGSTWKDTGLRVIEGRVPPTQPGTTSLLGSQPPADRGRGTSPTTTTPTSTWRGDDHARTRASNWAQAGRPAGGAEPGWRLVARAQEAGTARRPGDPG